MKPPPFEYAAPATLDDALELLAQHGDEAKVLAGGQSLIPILALRLAHPAWLVDLAGLPELASLAVNGSVSIGARVTQRQAERNRALGAAHPLLAQALPLIGHPQIRNRGTVCGSLAHADPAAELPAVALACDATMVVHGPRGTRHIEAKDFFVSYLETAVAVDEVLTEVRFARLDGPGTGSSIQEISRRHGDFAMAGAACVVRVDTRNRAESVSIALFGVGATPVRAPEAEALVRGNAITPELVAEAADVAQSHLDPPSDVHGSGAYRRHIAGVLIRRTLRAAVDDANKGLR